MNRTALITCLLLIAAVSCSTPPPEPESPASTSYPFREAAAESGLRFEHFVGATGDYLFPETTVPGAALFDYDNDGDLDVYALQGSILDDILTIEDSLFPPPARNWPGNRLFRNEIVPSGRLSFTDVTGQAGVGHEGYSNGAAVGDYDNDGDLDLYVSDVSANVFYRNNGDGTFADVTAQTNAGDDRWSATASFFDYDLDGDLDLFIVNYVDFNPRHNKQCRGPGDVRDYCGPLSYETVPDRLLRNEGDGTFSDVSSSAGITAAYGSGLGGLAADFNSDGWLDYLVANDGRANQLWQNNQDGTFEDIGLFSGTAFNADGEAEASMGIAVGDLDGDGDDDILMAHLATESNTLYINDGDGLFTDATYQFGLAAPSMAYTGFGTSWFDYDHDALIDLFVANGAVTIVESQRADPFPYKQRNLLFHNDGGGKIRDVTGESGPALALEEVSRGAAFGDIDNDGDIDILVANCNGPLRLLLNEAGAPRSWLAIQLEGTSTNRDGVGSRIEVRLRGRPTLWRTARTDGSYASASDRRAHFGLGSDPEIESVVVHWLGGEAEMFGDIKPNTLARLRQGDGAPIP